MNYPEYKKYEKFCWAFFYYHNLKNLYNLTSFKFLPRFCPISEELSEHIKSQKI